VTRGRIFPILMAGMIAFGATGAAAQDQGAPPPGGNFSGSVAGQPVSGLLSLSLQDAIARGLKQNLGLLLSNSDVRSAGGQRWQALAAILPHFNAAPYLDTSQVSLTEFGFNFKFPPSLGFSIPSVVGPFSYYDTRVSLSDSALDLSALNKTHAATERLASSRHTLQDARDLVVLSVGYAYLQTIAAEARVDTAQAQVQTAQALYDQANDQVNAGTSPQIDGLRAQVELKTRQQQLISAKNQVEIEKLTLARTIGLAPGQQIELTDKQLYTPFAGITVDEALRQAYANRSDFQAAQSDVRAAELSLRAAHVERIPTLSVNGDIGAAGSLPSGSAANVYDIKATLNIPIWNGNVIHGDIEVADAQLQQSRDKLENLRGEIDSDVRTALLDIQSAQDQVAVAQSNIDLAEQTLTQSRDRFSAGVTDTVEVVQAEEAVASAHENYISALYSYNYSKISLARALGAGEQGVKQYFNEGR
jgi:outer membrane protein TolC